MTPQELNDFQTSQLAELDTQLAVWGQRLQLLDQQIMSVQQNISESLVQLRGHLNNLVVAADEWLAQAGVDPTTPPELIAKVTSLKAKVLQLGLVSDETDTDTLLAIAEDLQNISVDLRNNLTLTATTFAAALDQAELDLVTHFGIQI